MEYILMINATVLVVMIVVYFLLVHKTNNELAQLKKYKEETDHKLDILIRVSHKHEQFIDNVKQLSEDKQIRNRKVVR